MPSNEVVINGNITYEVPDSYMGPLEAYLEMVKGKNLGAVSGAPDDGGPEEGQVYSQGAPTIVDEDSVPVQNDSFVQRLANESLHMVCALKTKLEPVLLSDDGTTLDAKKASPVVETWQAVHGHLRELVKRLDL